MKTKMFIAFLFYFIFSIESQCQWNWIELPSPGGIPTCLYYNKPKDELYIGCWGGVWKLNKTKYEWTELDSDSNYTILANTKILALYLDSHNVFYAGTDD